MKHFLKLTLVAALSLLCLTACGKGGKNVEVDVEALASALQSETVTSDTLTQAAPEMFSSIYFVESDQMEAGAAYLSSGATGLRGSGHSVQGCFPDQRGGKTV